jgi:hypothetical protein
MSKKERFMYLSSYYIELLEAKEEIEKQWIIKISLGVENNIWFSLWKIESVDKLFKISLRDTLTKAIMEVELEINEFIDNQLN